MYSVALESGRGIEGEVRREADSTTQGAGTIRGQLRLRTSAAQHLRELSLRQPHDKRIAVRVHRTSDTEENGLGERKSLGHDARGFVVLGSLGRRSSPAESSPCKTTARVRRQPASAVCFPAGSAARRSGAATSRRACGMPHGRGRALRSLYTQVCTNVFSPPSSLLQQAARGENCSRASMALPHPSSTFGISPGAKVRRVSCGGASPCPG
jgi:hypothetical protein